jgi:hypothetical protein
MFDGYEYRWMHNINDKWEIHFIEPFKSYKKGFSYLRFALNLWDKELKTRINKTDRKEFFINVGEYHKTEEKIRKIAKSSLPTIEKINFMRLENPNIGKYQVCELLDIKDSIYYRYLRTLKQRGTLLSALMLKSVYSKISFTG